MENSFFFFFFIIFKVLLNRGSEELGSFASMRHRASVKMDFYSSLSHLQVVALASFILWIGDDFISKIECKRSLPDMEYVLSK